ncbi:hypothetical protein GM182_00010 [bacterium 3DAC]|nr:hypothetical protein GM182_00010 [bacterium 3DAC]
MMMWITKNWVVDNICESQTYPHRTIENITLCGNVENYVDIIHNLPTAILQAYNRNNRLSTDTHVVSSSTSNKKTYIMKETIRRGALWA